MELSEAQEVATRLIELHGLSGWTFRFNRNKRRLGVCKQDSKQIELSEHYVIRNSSEHVIDTILHELAHALVGTEHGHDDVWKDMCIRLGCTPNSCSNTAIMPEGYWQARCPGCHSTFTRHRRPRRLRGRYCVACGPDNGQLVFRDMRVVKAPPAILPAAIKSHPAAETPQQLLLKLLFG
jgi:predicted SprT family Zn-dependent metalloprotease